MGICLALLHRPAPLKLQAAALTPLPSPASTNSNSTFATAAEALGMLLQVVGNLADKVQTKELDSIHSEDVILSASVNALLHQATFMELPRRNPFRAEVTQFSQHVAALHLAGDTRREAAAVKELQNVQASFDRIKTYFPETALAAARHAASVFTCPRHRDVIGQRTDTCPKCAGQLDQQVRLVPAFCGLPTPNTNPVRATVRTEQSLATGTVVTAFLQLTRADRTTVYYADLITAHTERIQLLLIDSSLTDYHHEHPRPTSVPGEYAFSFTPRQPGPYTLWADLRPQPLGLQEYATTTLPAPTMGQTVDRTLTNRVVVDGLIYQLSFGRDTLKANVPTPGRLRISQSDGTPFTQLEPLMEAFAHLVAFHEDGQTILHLHPKGAPVRSSTARGGPELEFQLYAMKPGFVRLFAQVQIGGVTQYAPFGLRVVW